MKETRTEYDSMGPVEVPAHTLYGAQTQRAVDNFSISDQKMRAEFIRSLLLIKLVAADTNQQLGLLNPEQGSIIVKCCNQLLTDFHMDQFPVPVYQTGSGTSTNMNVNEVVATLCRQKNIDIHPNDHVNLGQSSNDVIPSALLISTVTGIIKDLLPAIDHLMVSIAGNAERFRHIVKTGRTHLMDALPVKISAEFLTWNLQLDECRERFSSLLPRLSRLPLGGTAVGSGVNCHPDFATKAIRFLSHITDISFEASPLAYKGLSSLDTPLEASGHLKTLATVLLKISNDLRWMNSGPLAGLGEITLPPLQPGSSIMPAKVNPVIPEAVCMAAAQVTGFDCANTVAAQSSTFQLNTMLPLIADNLLHALSLLTGSCYALADKVFNDLHVNIARCSESLSKNPILVTALVPEIGYEQAAIIGKTAVLENRPILDVALEKTDITKEKLICLLDPMKLADGNQ
ncbi:lyase family protein [Desulfopila sp. IMCC35008]|uniref:class II fumarate hydratase n=1 Tax=Desulfopila sp. IMCC35008 TaxID=2653858 RepID=UPI0013D74D19|nr:class II fumarate hydratase [Desulfopila sp. IMCC35008]